MKTPPFVLVALLALTAAIRSQALDEGNSAPGDSGAVPAVLPTTARIIGNIPDGTPPPPEPPRPAFVIPGKANPPQPKNITINYWRTERPAPVKGENK